uniref:Smr domain-containing protein n=1 Tax=Kalanchoe fedtschenkoi TaxID=63787 RepID=A0A7N0U591_KALFE
MIGSLHILPPWRLSTSSTVSFRPPECALTKQGERFLTSLVAVADDSAAANRLIRKFVASSPKAVALTTLSHLLSPNPIRQPQLSLLALPLYRRMSEATWFSWNPKLAAELISLLESQSRFEEADVLISETLSKLGFRERELVLFYSNLIDSQSKHKLGSARFDTEACLKEMILGSSSVYVKQRAYEAVIAALCSMDRVAEAEGLIGEMRRGGLKPSVYEFRCVVHGYGRMGLFEDMMRIVDAMEKAGLEVDTVCSNMILSSYGAGRRYAEMAAWVGRMKKSSVGLSIRTYNSVLNSCTKIMALVQDMGELPLSIKEMMNVLGGDEGLVIQELIESSVLIDVMEMSLTEGKLDLHGMHLGSAYLIILQWTEELKLRWGGGESMIPQDMVVVCGLGKHSINRGESPVKEIVKVMMGRMGSPFRLDRKNAGCFTAKGRAVKNWLC